MARAIWTGSISFGLLNVPVRLYSAVSRKSVSFRELRASDKSRIRHKRVAESDGEEVPGEEIVEAVSEEPKPTKAPDLRPALEETLAAVKGEPLAAGAKGDGGSKRTAPRRGGRGRKTTAKSNSKSSSSRSRSRSKAKAAK